MEISKILGQRWQQLSVMEKASYEQAAREDYERYRNELELWRKRTFSSARCVYVKVVEATVAHELVLATGNGLNEGAVNELDERKMLDGELYASAAARVGSPAATQPGQNTRDECQELGHRPAMDQARTGKVVCGDQTYQRTDHNRIVHSP